MSFDGRSGLMCSDCSLQFFFRLSLVHRRFSPRKHCQGLPRSGSFSSFLPSHSALKTSDIHLHWPGLLPPRKVQGHALQLGLHWAYFVSECLQKCQWGPFPMALSVPCSRLSPDQNSFFFQYHLLTRFISPHCFLPLL